MMFGFYPGGWDYLHYMYLNILMQTCRTATQQASLMCGLFTSLLLNKSFPTYVYLMYCLISAQMLVGRAAAQDEHNSA